MVANSAARQQLCLSHTRETFTRPQAEHLLAPEHIASGMLKYRKQERSRFIPKLITKDRKKNNRALESEVDAGLDIFRQWWQYEPYEDRPPGAQHRQTETTRHSDLGYAVMRGRNSGLRRYWRFRAIISVGLAP